MTSSHGVVFSMLIYHGKDPISIPVAKTFSKFTYKGYFPKNQIKVIPSF